jgi:hypothetical protein
MLQPDRKPGVRLVTDRLQTSRIGAPTAKGYKPPEPITNSPMAREMLAEAERITAEAAKA